MDRLTKALKRLSPKQRKQLLAMIVAIEAGEVDTLDITKLKGYRYLFRVRKGDLRLIVRRDGDSYKAIALESRSEQTYRHLGKDEG